MKKGKQLKGSASQLKYTYVRHRIMRRLTTWGYTTFEIADLFTDIHRSCISRTKNLTFNQDIHDGIGIELFPNQNL